MFILGTHGVHGTPLGEADLKHVKTTFGYNPEECFVVPTDVKIAYDAVKQHGYGKETSWNNLFEEYSKTYPELALEFKRRMSNELLQVDWKSKLPVYLHTDSKAVATRSRSSEVLNVIASTFPEIMGGSADLTPSNLTSLKVLLMFIVLKL